MQLRSTSTVVSAYYYDEAHPPTSYMGIDCSPLPQNNGNLPLPFFGGNDPIVHLENIY